MSIKNLTAAPETGLGASPLSMVWVGGEFISYDSFAFDGEGNAVLVGLHRGLLNTAMYDHPEDAEVILVNGGGLYHQLTKQRGRLSYYKLVPNAVSSIIDISGLTEQDYTYYGEKDRPYILVDLKVNSEYLFTGFDVDVDLTVTFSNKP